MYKKDYVYEAEQYLVDEHMWNFVDIHEVLTNTLRHMASGFQLPPFEDFFEGRKGCYSESDVMTGFRIMVFSIENPPDTKVLLTTLNEYFARMYQHEIWIVAHDATVHDGQMALTFYAFTYEDSFKYYQTHSLEEYLEYGYESAQRRLNTLLFKLRTGRLLPLPYDGEKEEWEGEVDELDTRAKIIH